MARPVVAGRSPWTALCPGFHVIANAAGLALPSRLSVSLEPSTALSLRPQGAEWRGSLQYGSQGRAEPEDVRVSGGRGGSESFPTGCPVHGDTCSFNSAARLRNIGVDSVLRKARRTEVGPGHPVKRDPTRDAPWPRANAAGEAGEKCRVLLQEHPGARVMLQTQN